MTPNKQRSAFIDAVARGLEVDDALESAGIDPTSAPAKIAIMYLNSDEGQRELESAKNTAIIKSKLAKDRTSEDVLTDVRDVYHAAMAEGDLKSALRALELEGKHLGTFADKIEVSGSIDLVSTISAGRRRARMALDDVTDVEPVETEAPQIEMKEDEPWL